MTVGKQHEKPVYVRLRETIADAILAGRYGDGDPLPSVRALAAEEQANPLTVAQDYQGFQDEGLVVVKRGVGMFVADGAQARLRASERHRFLKEEWPEFRARMHRLGIDVSELIERERARTSRKERYPLAASHGDAGPSNPRRSDRRSCQVDPRRLASRSADRDRLRPRRRRNQRGSCRPHL